jgi:hypothetical protein
LTKKGRVTAAALRRLEQWCDPDPRLAARDRPSHGIARHPEVLDPTRSRRSWVPSSPRGVSTPSGHLAGRRSARLSPVEALLVLSLPYRGPSQHPRTVPPGPKTGTSDDASSPGLSRPTTHPGRRTRIDRASGSTACHVRGFRPPSRRPPPSLPAPEGVGASMGFTLQGFDPRVERASSRTPLPSCRSPRRFAASPGDATDAVDFRALLPARSRASSSPLRDPPRRCLPGIPPSRAFSLLVLATASVRGASLHTHSAA